MNTLDFLYHIGCQYDLSDEDMSKLCFLCGVSFEQLQQHSPKVAA